MDTQTKQELWRVKYVASLLTPKAPLGIVLVLTKLITIVLGWFTPTVEVFIRRPGSCGYRYLSLLRLWLGYTVMGAFTFCFTLFSVLAGGINPMAFFGYSGGLSSLFATGVSSVLYHVYLYGFLGLSALHLYTMWKRQKQGVQWHSMSSGISWLESIPFQRLMNAVPYLSRFVTADEWLVTLYIEPVAVNVAGRLLWHADPLLGWWLMIASVALLLRQWISYLELKGRVAALIDSSIEATYLSAALSGTHKKETAGFSVIPVPMQDLLDNEPLDLAATVRDTLGLEA